MLGRLSALGVGGSEDVRRELLMDLSKVDFLLKQKVDQLNGLFGAAVVSNYAGFWAAHFGPKKMVPWTEFVPVFLAGAGCEGSSCDEGTLSQFLDFTLDGWVSVYEFETFLVSFGPLAGCVERLMSPFRSGILAGFVPSVEATAVLNGRDPGCFLIRLSKSSPGSFAVTFVDSKGRIKHCLLYAVKPFGVTLKDPPDVFPTLDLFVKAHGTRLKTPVGSLTQRYRTLEQSLWGNSAYSQSLLEGYLEDNSGAGGGGGGGAALGKCVVCMTASVGVCFIPCGHVCCCRDCGRTIEGMKEKRCPLCRQDVQMFQQVYIN